MRLALVSCLVVLVGCSIPQQFMCDPESGQDCDAGTPSDGGTGGGGGFGGGSTGGGTSAGGGATGGGTTAPSGLRYEPSLLTCTRGIACSLAAPFYLGSPVSFSVAPTLPEGLGLNTQTGAIGGVPSAIAPQASYTVTAQNDAGATTTTVAIVSNDVAPDGVTYSSTSLVCVINQPCGLSAPTSTGGAVTAFSIWPSLPTGLTLDPQTGALNGTPTVASVQRAYTVTASNSGGDTTRTLTLRVNDVPPTSLAYAPSALVCTKGDACSLAAPTHAGGQVTSYSVLPALPSGLSLNGSTGDVGGTPTEVAALKSYTVTASNSGGSTTASISVTVKDLAPASLFYGSNPVTYVLNHAIEPNTPSSWGGAVVSYSVAPQLPAGLMLSEATGVISGTPSAPATRAQYTVTATNSGGTTTGVVTILVQPPAPVFTSQPSDQYVLTGTSATFRAAANGTGPLSFQWRLNDADVSGAHAPTWVSAPVGPTEVASISVVVGDSYENEVTSRTALLMATSGPFVSTLGELNTARYEHTATLLLDGGVLLFGGQGQTNEPAELYSPASKSFSTIGPAEPARSGHRAVRLNDGKVLIVGGSDVNGPSAPRLFDPATGAFTTLTGGTFRRFPTATLLNDGTVLITGGVGTTPALSSAEIFHPASRTFTTLAATMKVVRASHTATLLGNGKVLLAGGQTGGGTETRTAELFDPASGTFTATSDMGRQRANHTATLLDSGLVLVLGDSYSSASAELFNPATGTWTSTGSMTTDRTLCTANKLPDGTVLVIGDWSAELYSPGLGTFNAISGGLNRPRQLYTATLLSDGSVLIAGGQSTSTLSSAELLP